MAIVEYLIMALSHHEIDLNMRPPSLSESTVVFDKDPSYFQVEDMEVYSGVTLTQEERDLYVALRVKPANGEPLKSDQRLMADEVLTGEKRALFERAYPNIFHLQSERVK